MRVTLTDGRQMTGSMLAFDRVWASQISPPLNHLIYILIMDFQLQHMNLVLADTEEFRRVKRKPTKGAAPGGAPGSSAASSAAMVESEEKRTLGLTIVRGTHIISLSVEAPPAADPSARLGTGVPGVPGSGPPTLAAGPGISRPAGRGLPIGLTGPAAGVGGPAPVVPPTGFPPGFAPGRGGPGAPRMIIPCFLFGSPDVSKTCY